MARGGASFSRFKEKEAGGIQIQVVPRHTNFLRNGEAQYLYVFAPPTRAHTSSPAVFDEHCKTAGMAPL